MTTKVAESKESYFFEQNYRKLVNFVQKNMDKRFADASPEDIVQDVALSLLDKLNVDTQIENLAAYIYRSLKNKIFDTQQKKRISVSIGDYYDENNVNILNNAVIPDEDNAPNFYNYEPHQLLDAIEKLNKEDKYIIISNHFEGKSFQQLSDELKTPIGTLLSRKHRAQAKLEKILNASKIQ